MRLVQGTIKQPAVLGKLLTHGRLSWAVLSALSLRRIVHSDMNYH